MDNVPMDERSAQCIEQFREEFEGCVDGFEEMLIEAFLKDTTRSIEEREQTAKLLCEIIAVASAAFNLSSIVKSSGIREQMFAHFM